MAQKKQTEAKDTAAPVKEQAPAKSKSGSAAAKKTAAAVPADALAKPAATKAKVSDATAKPATVTAAPAAATAKPAGATAKVATSPAKKASAPKAAPKKAPTSQSASLTKVYGEIQTSENKYFIQNGSVPDGQLQLVPQKDKQELNSRIPSYNGQFVTVLGEFADKKKTDKSSIFTIHSIASHDEIARKAYELSHENPADVEDNWFRAENEILQPK